ncbi:hypothetical protein GLOTRDRAFT_129653 [Gloeophyllum trabeum ATCC 11539]|uniref:N-acetyltransferase domain-containing protein n=1 Tax=Gloeophyllum trabeum (strain ATCC 11539 / FP-39264 / Madison 617) TaxID=670483 RepID=S7Q7F1_GLOTA|nr:uncharacterized protein GLOTRDRAFT_129653 [Gloeophyllum trabeum ATCC 11539]EPQ55378.1 hypothetical protein GLOTRDRAFT_129653 [Gloeophyllum trabeum ATCC 11539]
MARAVLAAGTLHGEYYGATDSSGQILGFILAIPPGRDLFSTEVERELGFNEFMDKLSDAGKEYFKTTYTNKFHELVEESLGPKGNLKSFWIYMVMVRPEYQRKGIARALMGLLREKASSLGHPVALSTTNPNNVVVYQKMGFVLKGQAIMPSPWADWPIYVLSTS